MNAHPHPHAISTRVPAGALAGLIGLALAAATARAQLPAIDFEAYPPGSSIALQPGWSVRFGKALVTRETRHGSQTNVLRLVGGSRPSVEVERQVAGTPNDPVTFIDFLIRPVVEASDAPMTSIHVNGALLAFLRTENAGGLGSLYALDGSDDSQGTGWVALPLRFPLEADGRTAANWMRLTIRQDLANGVWDLFVDGRLFAADLGYDGGTSALTEWLMFGSSSARDVLIDNLRAVPANPLFTDADADGIADDFETARGWDPAANDRNLAAADAGSPGPSRLEDYLQAVQAAYAAPGGALANTLRDTDADGMPDFWETLFGLDPANPGDAATDIDRDGASNLAEYRRGTTPKSPPLYQLVDPDLPGRGNYFPRAFSDAYHVAGYFINASGVSAPFVWHASTGVREIPLPAGARSGTATTVNDNGDTGGTYIDASGRTKGFAWTGGNLVTVFPSQNYSYVTDINASGSLCGYYIGSDNQRRAFRGQPGAEAVLTQASPYSPMLHFNADSGTVGGTGVFAGKTQAIAITPAGILSQLLPSAHAPTYSFLRGMTRGGIAGGYFGSAALGTRPFRWTPQLNGSGTTEILAGFGGSNYAVCNGIGEDGALVGISRDATGQNRAALWLPGETLPVNLGHLGGSSSSAFAVVGNAGYHEVFGTAQDAKGVTHPFVWKFGQMRVLKDCTRKSGSWSLTSVVGVLPEGDVVVAGYKDNRQTFGILWREVDSDGDGVSDDFENDHGMNPLDSADAELDFDGDSLANAIEYLQQSNPSMRDSDRDQMPDDWEYKHHLDPADPSDAGKDYDGDRLTNRQEYYAGTNPQSNFELEASTGIQGDYVSVSAMSGNTSRLAGSLTDYSAGVSNQLWAWSPTGGRRDLSLGYSLTYAWIVGISDDGFVVGAGYDMNYQGVVVVWPPSSPNPSIVTIPGATSAYPTSVNGAGRVSVSCYSSSNGTSSNWNASFSASNPAGTMSTLINPGGTVYSHLIGESNGGARLFSWNQGSGTPTISSVLPTGVPWAGATHLYAPDATGTTASRINGAGQVLVAASIAGGAASFLWTDGTFKDVTPTRYGGGSYYPVGFNDKGHVLVSSSAGGLLLRNGATVPLDRLFSAGPGWVIGTPGHIDNAGMIVGSANYNGRGTFFRLKLKDDENQNGIPDDWERFYFPIDMYGGGGYTASGDADGDGLSNQNEFLLGTDPTLADTDRDGISDAIEIARGTDPLVSDLVAPAALLITEFVANTGTSIIDNYGTHPDWLELHNTTGAPLDVSGWRLQDSEFTWLLPNATLPAGAYRVVYLSDRNRVDTATDGTTYWHANFKLKNEGEYLCLRNPSGTVVQEFNPKYPYLGSDISYALVDGFSRWTFCDLPTPGAPNPESGSGAASHYFDRTNNAWVYTSHYSGYFTAPFDLRIYPYLSGGQSLLYTLDGSDPAMDNPASLVYATGQSVRIETTTTLRYRVVGEGLQLRPTVNATYLFPEDVLRQKRPAGFPSTVPSRNGAPLPLVTDMNASAVAHYGADSVKAQLQAAPVVSLSIPEEQLFGSPGTIGLFAQPWNPLPVSSSIDYWESPALGGSRFSAAASIQVARRPWISGSSRPWQWLHSQLAAWGNSGGFNEVTQKHSFEIDFARNPQGLVNANIFKVAARAGGPNVNKFQRLVLRSPLEDSFAYAGDTDPAAATARARATYLKDWWVAETQRALLDDLANEIQSATGIRPVFPAVPRRKLVHLYLNGLYWGVYELMEKLDGQFLADHLANGSTSDDIRGLTDVPFFAIESPALANYSYSQVWWQAMRLGLWKAFGWSAMEQSLDGQIATAHRDALKEVFDTDAFIDYVLLNVLVNNADWPARRDTFVTHEYSPLTLLNGGSRFGLSGTTGLPVANPDTGDYLLPAPGDILTQGYIFPQNAERSFNPWSPGGASPWEALLGPRVGGIHRPLWSGADASDYAYFFRSLAYDPDFQLRLKQRMDRHFGPGGLLSREASLTRLHGLYLKMSQLIRAESARWGHAAPPEAAGRPFHTDRDWQNAVFWIRDHYFTYTGPDGTASGPESAHRDSELANLPVPGANNSIVDPGAADWNTPPPSGDDPENYPPVNRDDIVDQDAPGRPGYPEEEDAGAEPEEFERDPEITVIAHLPGTFSAPGAPVTPPPPSEKYISILQPNDDNDDGDPIPDLVNVGDPTPDPEGDGEPVPVLVPSGPLPRDNDESPDTAAAISAEDDDIVKIELGIGAALSPLNESQLAATTVTLTIPAGVRPFDKAGNFLPEDKRTFLVPQTADDSTHPLRNLAAGEADHILVEGLHRSKGGSVILRVNSPPADGYSSGGGYYNASNPTYGNPTATTGGQTGTTTGQTGTIPVQATPPTTPPATTGGTRTGGVVLQPIDILEVISDQIAGNEANKLPTAYFGGNPAKPWNGHPNNPMLMATRTAQNAKLIIKIAKPNVLAYVGVRKIGTQPVLGSASCFRTRIPLDFDVPANSHDFYEVVAGYDLNGNFALDDTEAIVVFEKTPRIDKDGNAASVNLHLVDKIIIVDQGQFSKSKQKAISYNVPGSEYAGDLIEAFARGSKSISDATTSYQVNLSSTDLDLSHPVGAKWNALNQDSTYRFTFPDGSPASDDTEASNALKQIVEKVIADNKANMISSYTGTPEWPVSPYYRFSIDKDFIATDPDPWGINELGNAFGRVILKGELRISYKKTSATSIKVGAIEVVGTFDDLYDFQYGKSDRPREASMVQAGHATIAPAIEPDGGKVFYTRVEFNTGFASTWNGDY